MIIADVVLVAMPFGPRQQPSLGLSLLKAALDRAGVPAKVSYPTLEFAAELGPERYDRISASSVPHLAGEWIFSGEVFAQPPEHTARYAAEILGGLDAEFRSDVLAARACAADFIERTASRILELQPRVVGFTSTFQQQLASLAVARRLKEGDPLLKIVFGGANCETVMGAELVAQFPYVDAVVSGEGDLVVADLAGKLLDGTPIEDLPGVYTAANLQQVAAKGYPSAPSVRDMDALPYPDYADFFAQLHPPAEGAASVFLLFETARGCWWGEKHHCTFCGLNGATMTFRSKSAARALAELEYLAERYRTRSIAAVDNILDMTYFRDFLPELARRDLKLNLFYEVKANLKKEQLRLLRDAGVRKLQPGIESLSTDALTRMRKGVRGLQNIQFLKWCKEFGLFVSWNMLWGFPGEDPREHAAVTDRIAAIGHLKPPDFAGPIRLDRFSPHFDSPQSFGICNVRPCAAYPFVYDIDESAIARLAYFFEFDHVAPEQTVASTAELSRAVTDWTAEHVRSELLSIDFGDTLLILDCRPGATDAATVLSGLDRTLYLACDGICGLNQLQALAAAHGTTASRAAIEERVGPWLRARLMLREGDGLLSLAVPFGEYPLGEELRTRLDALTALFSAAAA